jgi:TPR repeat protein/uncharacterized protein YecT (DUF1311 family)
LGEAYEDGTGVDKNMAEAASLYAKACDGGDPRGCNDLGFFYHKGYSVSQDEKKAFDLYRRSCDGGDARGCGNLALSYSLGKGAPKDPIKAASLHRKACDGKEAWSCTNLGNQYNDGEGVAKDERTAVALFGKGCDLGDALGCANLGFMYESGSGGLTKDEGKAVELYRRSCDSRNALGCTNGRGVAKDEVWAASYYREGCERGHAPGCSGLALLYETGRGVIKDEGRAAELYGQGCSLGDAEGCSSLASLKSRIAATRVPTPTAFTPAPALAAGAPCDDLYHGIGIAKDLPAARQCFEQELHEPCHGQAQLNRAELAVMYLDGQGGPAAPEQGWALLKGCEQDSTIEGLIRTLKDRKPTGTLDFCHDIGGTTGRSEECAQVDLDLASAAGEVVVKKAQAALGGAIVGPLTAAQEAWNAFAEAHADQTADARVGGGTALVAESLDALKEAEMARTSWLAALPSYKPDPACGASGLAAADAALNATYRRALGRLRRESQELLRKAQRAWIASRDADAVLAAAAFGVRDGAPLVEADIKCRATKDRTKQLQAIESNKDD